MKKLLTILIASARLAASAMDRFAALSQIESGDNDSAVGKAGEVSRYQIMPGEWSACTSNVLVFPLGHPEQTRKQIPTNKIDANEVAIEVQWRRTESFVKRHHRQPTDAEWYLLWHRPATVLGGRKPTARELDRAQRFANLCAVK